METVTRPGELTGSPLPGVKRPGREVDGLLRGYWSCRVPEDNHKPIHYRRTPSRISLNSLMIIVIDVKGKGKGRLWVLQHCCLEAYCTLTPNEFLYSSPEALHTQAA